VRKTKRKEKKHTKKNGNSLDRMIKTGNNDAQANTMKKRVTMVDMS